MESEWCRERSTVWVGQNYHLRSRCAGSLAWLEGRRGMWHHTCLNMVSVHGSPPPNQTSYLAPPESKSARACQVPVGCASQGSSRLDTCFAPDPWFQIQDIWVGRATAHMSVPKWCWHCWSKDRTLRTTALNHGPQILPHRSFSILIPQAS